MYVIVKVTDVGRCLNPMSLHIHIHTSKAIQRVITQKKGGLRVPKEKHGIHKPTAARKFFYL